MGALTRERRIAADYAAGVPVKEIMRRHVCSSRTVMVTIRATHLAERGKHRAFTYKPRDGGKYMTGGTELDIDNVVALSEQRSRDAALDVARTLAMGRAKILDEPIEAYAAARREAGIK